MTAWDLSTLYYDSVSLYVYPTVDSPYDVEFSSDGTKMYLAGRVSGAVYQYNLSIAWDLSTATYASKSFSVSTQDSIPEGLAFSSDGTKMYMVGSSSDTAYQYTLGTAWDLATATYASKTRTVGAQDTVPRCLAFSADGTKMYMMGSSSDAIYQYTLTTAWDLATASYASKTFSVVNQETVPTGMGFSSDGSLMFIVGSASDAVYQYSLSLPWDVSTATYASKSFSVAGQETTPQGIAFSSDGMEMFLTGTGSSVYEYKFNRAPSKPTITSPVNNTTVSLTT